MFGLEGTRALDAYVVLPDRDDDSIPDDRDNCPDHANAAQEDGDFDQMGDACDGCEACAPCDRGPSHDEDGDRIADGCDLCPGNAEPSGNIEGDELGDGCDPGPAAHRRVLFDGFAVLSPYWLEAGRWHARADEVAPVQNLANKPYLLRHATAQISNRANWQVEAGLARPPVGATMSVDVVDQFGGGYGCAIQRLTEGEWNLYAAGTASATYTQPLPPVLVLRLSSTSATGQTLRCVIVGTTYEVSRTTSTLSYPVGIQLYSDFVGTPFMYIDVASL